MRRYLLLGVKTVQPNLLCHQHFADCTEGACGQSYLQAQPEKQLLLSVGRANTLSKYELKDWKVPSRVNWIVSCQATRSLMSYY